jgi:hypothetical protein
MKPCTTRFRIPDALRETVSETNKAHIPNLLWPAGLNERSPDQATNEQDSWSHRAELGRGVEPSRDNPHCLHCLHSPHSPHSHTKIEETKVLERSRAVQEGFQRVEETFVAS